MSRWRKRQIQEKQMPMEIHEDKIVMRAGKYDFEAMPRAWAKLIQNMRVEGDTVVIKVKNGNDSARWLYAALIEEINK
jgi:hypothetical protein